MEHYLITRFNLKNENWQHSNAAKNGLSKTWLDKRFHIFETYCLPSVKNQTNKSFKWLVCLDIDTPDIYNQKIENLKTQLPFFIPLFIDGFHNLEQDISKFIKIDSKEDFIITTRLDNDDILHKDFTLTIQNLYKPEQAVININLGYQLILKNNHSYQMRFMQQEFNPFMSVISQKDNFESVLSKEHDHWRSHNNQIINKSERLWIQFVHGSNVLNDINKAYKKAYYFDINDFGLKNISINESKVKVTLYNIIMLPYRLYYNLKLRLKKIIKNE